MSLVQLEYFVAIAEEKNLTRAAHKLRISQPPLTRQLRRLEEELGTPLFDRTPKGMTLLPSGQRLLARAKQILALVSESVRELQTHGVTDQLPSVNAR